MERPWPLPANCEGVDYPASALYPKPTFDRSGMCILSSPGCEVTSADLPWPLPVRHYERTNAAVLSGRPTVDESGKLLFYSYSIEFDLVRLGTDPTQQLASDFVLLTPGVLASEVVQMSVKLYLPCQAFVEANFHEREKMALNIDQVDLAKQFNTWLFDVVLGRPGHATTESGCMDSPKGYYVLPLRSNNSNVIEVDWPMVRSSLHSGLVYTTDVKVVGGMAKFEPTNTDDRAPAALAPGCIIMRNGAFSVDDLHDAMITCAHNGMPCFVNAMSKHLDSSSRFPSRTGVESTVKSYADYYASKCNHVVKNEKQPLLSGGRLQRAANCLKRQEADTAKAMVQDKASERLELPPEICLLHVGVKGKLCRGAMRLPSVLYRVEITSLAAELRDHIGVPISCFKVLKALTSRACEGDVSYEALELLGDSILKFTGCTYLFLKEFLETKEQLCATLYELVRNKTLSYCALARGLARYAFVEPFVPSVWTPPGMVGREVVGQLPVPAKEHRRKFQLISSRTLADMVEALVGAYLLAGGLDTALRAMAWLRVPISFPATLPKTIKTSLFGTERSRELCRLINIEELESKLGYTFKDKNLLAGAMNYDFHDSKENSIFKRLMFLGDGIFDYVITRHLIRTFPDEDEGQLTELKQAIRKTENLARLAVIHGFHTFLRRASPSLDRHIADYVSSFVTENGQAFGLSTVRVPKGLGDLLQTLAAAMYMDCDRDIERVWVMLRPLLEPLATPRTLTFHPIKQLEILCLERGWSLKIHADQLDRLVRAEVRINELVVGNSQNEDKKIARRLAATMALRGISNQNGLPTNGFH